MYTGEVDSDPEEVLIAGRASVLSGINEISVSDASLDITGLTEDLRATIDLSGYLPGNVSFGDEDFNGIATVEAHIEAASDKTVDVSYNQIALENIPEGYEAKIISEDDRTFGINLKGLKNTIASVSATDISGTVDIAAVLEKAGELEDYTGIYDATVSLSLPGGVTTSDFVTVSVEITKIEE